MIELAILVLFIVLITGVILVYKKYVKVVNVINDEQNRKYKEISELIGSNNENIKENKKDTQDILNRDNVDVNELENIINDNNKRVKTNKNNLNKYNFEDLNKIFSYDNGFIIGNSSSQINIGDNNIRLNVENPSKIRVCNEQNECTGSNSFGTLQGILKDYPLLENDLSSSHIDSKDKSEDINTNPTVSESSLEQSSSESSSTESTIPESLTKTFQINIKKPGKFFSVEKNGKISGDFESNITLTNENAIAKYESMFDFTFIETKSDDVPALSGIIGTIDINNDEIEEIVILNNDDEPGDVELIELS